MKSVWRFVVFWRYLLLACLVLVGAGEYLLIGLPRSIVATAPQPSSLRGKYDRIEKETTEAEVMEILGPPQYKEESMVMDFKMMDWVEGQDCIHIFFLWGDTGRVLQKQLITRSAPSASSGEH
ncbi:MAG TPA: hypothetical protein VMG10_23710 [Gemmataceae bacterium]|nr:hypothetical protein [Gemmataceae bacterium]